MKGDQNCCAHHVRAVPGLEAVNRGCRVSHDRDWGLKVIGSPFFLENAVKNAIRLTQEAGVKNYEELARPDNYRVSGAPS